MDGSGEGSGKIVNYMGAGLPVVCFDTVNNRMILGENGFFAKPGDVNDLADSVLKALTDDETAKNIGAANRQRVYTKLSWHESGKNLIAVYRNAITRQ